jgi:predicted Rdx family selenoprotein
LPRAARVAALITQASGLEVDLEPGSRGEFTVWVDGMKVAEKSRSGFPADTPLLAAVQQALTQ